MLTSSIKRVVIAIRIYFRYIHILLIFIYSKIEKKKIYIERSSAKAIYYYIHEHANIISISKNVVYQKYYINNK